ncbi:MAG: class I SAM-dependent methyltransferase [Planctomycetota bacterium]|jgi:SAM-dependent methyltransferase
MSGAARTLSPEELCHERLGDEFARAVSAYDTRRRLETLIDDFLTDEMVVGRRVLDAGCGLGFFAERLKKRGADVIACDIGPSLVERASARAGCPGEVADALGLVDHFGAESFDVVVSSECIEHTPDPMEAVRQMAGVLRVGGHLSLSTPNILWQPCIRLATRCKMRPFDGHENFSSWRGLRATLKRCGVPVLRERGLYLFPFRLGLHRISGWCDRRLQIVRGLMMNICILGRRSAIPPGRP